MNELFHSLHFPSQVRISQKYQLSLYVQKCDEVLDYLHKGAGHNFLQQQSWVGDEGGVAEELLNQQNEFENVFQVCLHFFSDGWKHTISLRAESLAKPSGRSQLLQFFFLIRTRLESLCNQHRQSVSPSVLNVS